MLTKYKVRNNSRPYFITTTIVNWVDIFSRKSQKEKLVESLAFCQNEKGLVIYAWCLISNHLHMICQSSDEEKQLSDIMRDYKGFTSKQVINTIIEEGDSRTDWMLNIFEFNKRASRSNSRYKVWQNGYHPIEIYSQAFLEQKLNYIHQNPVRAGIVEHPEHYLYSSARNYADIDGLLDVELVSRRPIFFS